MKAANDIFNGKLYSNMVQGLQEQDVYAAFLQGGT